MNNKRTILYVNLEQIISIFVDEAKGKSRKESLAIAKEANKILIDASSDIFKEIIKNIKSEKT